MLGIKRVENRSAMPVPAKGRCAISCSKSFCKEEYGEFVRWASRTLKPEDFGTIPAWCDVKDWPGKVIGCCGYEAGTARPESAPYQWDEGYPYWWKLSEMVSFDKPIPCRGNVGMWQKPPALAAQVTMTDELERSVGEVVATADDAARAFRAAVSIAGGNEGFFVLPLDADGRALTAPVLVSLGEPTTTAVDPSVVFAEALEAHASSVIVAHNHPTGELTPSEQDRRLTASLVQLGEALGVRVTDHLIVSSKLAGYRSVCERR